MPLPDTMAIHWCKLRLVKLFTVGYWKWLVLILVPIICSPLIVKGSEARCAYVLIISEFAGVKYLRITSAFMHWKRCCLYEEQRDSLYYPCA